MRIDNAHNNKVRNSNLDMALWIVFIILVV